MRALKILGIVCVVFACILAVITTALIISYAIKIIAAVAAVIGVLGLIGALTWLAICEAFGR